MKKKSILFLVLVLYCIIYSKPCFGNDTIKILKKNQIEKIAKTSNSTSLLVENKNFIINQYFFDHLSYTKNKNKEIYFRNSTFGTPPSGIFSEFEHRANFLTIDSCTIDNLPICNATGSIGISKSDIGVLSVYKTDSLILNIGGNRNISTLSVRDNKNMRLYINNCEFSDRGHAEISNTTLNAFVFDYSRKSGSYFNFREDTIINSFLIAFSRLENMTPLPLHYQYENVFTFFNCNINSEFIFIDSTVNLTLIFDNCTFGPKADLTKLDVNRMVIRNCLNINRQLPIGLIKRGTKKVKLEITNSAIENILFDFTPNLQLDFTSESYTTDAISNGYKNLLEKFKREGKERSYKYIDLQYRKFNDGRFFHFLNKIWWYHGYEPGLVFIWTSGLLTLFFLINLLCWDKMYETYPIVEGQKAEAYNRRSQRSRFFSSVFLYTVFIFFSLRVNFEKLKFKRLPFVYLFLLEYLAGLWCLVFIIRFVIKL